MGGLGHVGLPLGIALADQELKVCLYDLNRGGFEQVERGEMPFIEYDAEPILKRVINETLFLSSAIEDVGQSKFVIVTIGTPVDEHLNPDLRSVRKLFDELRPHLHEDQVIIIRSTVYPGTCKSILDQLNESGSGWKIAYCPERIAQGYAIRELKQFPQLVAGMTKEAASEAAGLLGRFASTVRIVKMGEAELAKLFSNAWRYIVFGVANQFHMIANDLGLDFNQVRKIMTENYGRAGSLPSAGFAAGPCLMKDTMQLAAFNNNNFMLGHAALMVNEGLPGYIVQDLRRRFDLENCRIGILGMAFKGNIDDTRDSLSYKLGKILRFHGAQVFYSDEFAEDPTFVSKEALVSKCDIIIVGANHDAYRELLIPESKELVDLWGIVPRK